MSRNKITNPILSGFNPDPSICRAGEDYYIATSTFEWFPGVSIYHSRDLKNWKLVKRPLERLSQLDMRGEANSCGVWAPCLTYFEGIFYLIYSDVKNDSGKYKDVNNYLVTTSDICKEWSEPIYLNSGGFDPSLFHDDDGRKWLVNMSWDHRNGVELGDKFDGIVLQEYSGEEQRLVGKSKIIYKGTKAKLTEGPHLYKENGYYYLLTAEGGTGYEHQVSFARSKKLDGPYQTAPNNPILTSKNKDCVLQRAGHGDIICTHTNEWYMVHLCSRPLAGKRRSVLGRETAIQKMKWKNDWIMMDSGGNTPLVEVDMPKIEECKLGNDIVRHNFDSNKLENCFQTLRIPLGEEVQTLSERPGFLRLYGKQSLRSHYTQALVARRWKTFEFEAMTCLEYKPKNYKQSAGLICLYDVNNYYYLNISCDDDGKRIISIGIGDEIDKNENSEEWQKLDNYARIYLKVLVNRTKLKFSYSYNGMDFISIGHFYDASVLSDEYGSLGGFTGAFVGMCCQDLNGTSLHADFDFFEYKE